MTKILEEIENSFSSKQDFMIERGKYIYGVMNSNTAFHLFIPKNSSEEWENGTKRVYTIPFQDISAVVCDAEMVDYTHLRKDDSVRLLVGHQSVIERIMNLGDTIIPVRFGTFAQDEVEVKDILHKGYCLIKDLIEKINGKIEIDVVATWEDFNSILKGVGEEGEIKEFKENLLSNPKGITVDDQIKLGVMIKGGLDGKRERCVQEIQNVLKSVSQDVKIHELMDDKMVINIAFLLNKARQGDFYKRIDEINTKFHDELNFRCIGPLPPYSFYTLEIKKIQFRDLDWARKKLGLLNDFASRDGIKRAYKAAAFSSHPDKNPDTDGIEKEFDEVNKAYKILWEYCQGDSCFFNEEEFRKNAILVKIRE